MITKVNLSTNINFFIRTKENILNYLIKKVLNIPIEKIVDYKDLLKDTQIISSKDFYNKLLETDNFEKMKLIYINTNYISECFPVKYKQKIINAIKNDKSIAYFYLNCATIEIVEDNELRNMFFNLSERYIDPILNYISHYETLENLYNDELFETTKAYLIKKHNLDPGHINILKTKFGPQIIKYIDNPVIQQIINLKGDTFQKLIDLFPQQKFEMKDVETYYDSFKQKLFAIKNPEIINIFSNILHSIADGTEECFYLINNLKTVWSETLIKKLIEKYPNLSELFKSDVDEFFNKLSQTLVSSNDEKQIEQFKDILNIITNHYIQIKREEYRITYNMYEELEINYTYKEKDLDQKLPKYLLIYSEEFRKEVKKKLKEKGLSEDVIDNLIDYYIYPNTTKNKGELENIETNIKNLIMTSKKIIEDFKQKHPQKIEELYDKIKKAESLPKNYYLTQSSDHIYKILCNLNFDAMKTFLSSDEYIKDYKFLQEIMKKYKLDTIPLEIQNNLISNLEYMCGGTPEDLSAFISYFPKINQKIKENNFSLSPYFISYLISISATTSSVYNQILGQEDATLIRANPGPNTNNRYTREERLELAVKKIIANYNVTEINVPSFIETFTLSSGKKIKAIVGNFTRPSNLTHGERTGACMRIGGVGESLFYSENIFHIEFRDSETNQYLSRVTCFRNGNTIFQNELRCSCIRGKYTDEEVVEADTIVSNLLIEQSQNSTVPIENVVVHRAYAMESIKDNRVQLNINNCKEGLSPFYTDINSYVHVLATTSNDQFTPVVLGNENVPKYQPVRDEIKKGNDSIILEQINRVHAVNLILNGQNYEYIAPITDTIIYGIAGEDWYVYINENNEIIHELINRDERATLEYETALEKIKTYLKSEEQKYAI